MPDDGHKHRPGPICYLHKEDEHIVRGDLRRGVLPGTGDNSQALGGTYNDCRDILDHPEFVRSFWGKLPPKYRKLSTAQVFICVDKTAFKHYNSVHSLSVEVSYEEYYF